MVTESQVAQVTPRGDHTAVTDLSSVSTATRQKCQHELQTVANTAVIRQGKIGRQYARIADRYLRGLAIALQSDRQHRSAAASAAPCFSAFMISSFMISPIGTASSLATMNGFDDRKIQTQWHEIG